MRNSSSHETRPICIRRKLDSAESRITISFRITNTVKNSGWREDPLACFIGQLLHCQLDCCDISWFILHFESCITNESSPLSQRMYENNTCKIACHAQSIREPGRPQASVCCEKRIHRLDLNTVIFVRPFREPSTHHQGPSCV